MQKVEVVVDDQLKNQNEDGGGDVSLHQHLNLLNEMAGGDVKVSSVIQDQWTLLPL